MKGAKPDQVAWVLALAGYIPFAALTVGLLLPQTVVFSLNALQLYAAIILSFLGGIRWGLAFTSDSMIKTLKDLLGSVIPALWAFTVFYLSPPKTLVLLALGFLFMGSWDYYTLNSTKAPLWFYKLRLILTILVTTTLVIAAIIVF